MARAFFLLTVGVAAAAACGLDRGGLGDEAQGAGGALAQGGAMSASVAIGSGGSATSAGGASSSSSSGGGGSQPQGSPCQNPAQCASGFCVDGLCCESACRQSCRSCRKDESGQPSGECQPVEAGTDPSMECGVGEACNGDGDCLTLNGEACDDHEDCISDRCIFEPGQGRLCCDTSCNGPCEACSQSKTGGADGLCSYVTAGTDPDDECNSPPSKVCDGMGQCI
jgi:hypothetical protein